MGRIKGWATDKAYDLQASMASQARMRYIGDVMMWEDVDYDTAVAICTGRTDPVEHEYTLGYKMCDPIYLLAMSAQASRKRREAAVLHFEELLSPEELDIFRRDVMDRGFRETFKKSLKHRK